MLWYVLTYIAVISCTTPGWMVDLSEPDHPRPLEIPGWLLGFLQSRISSKSFHYSCAGMIIDTTLWNLAFSGQIASYTLEDGRQYVTGPVKMDQVGTNYT